VSDPGPFGIGRDGGQDHRRSAPHVARNAEPIAEVLGEILPPRGLVLEVASGTGNTPSISRGVSRSCSGSRATLSRRR